MINSIFPYIGMIVRHINDCNSTKILSHDGCYTFIGTWIKEGKSFRLIDVNYQNDKTGSIITKEQIVDSLIF